MKQNNGYKVLTPNGWMNFEGIRKIKERETIEIKLNDGKSLKCTPDHRVFSNGVRIYASELKEHDVIDTKESQSFITSISNFQETDVFDLIEVGGNHSYFTNDIVSSNCEFVGYSETLIEGLILKKILEEAQISKPITMTGEVQWWKQPERGNTYIVGYDPSIGTGGDFAAIQVFELPGMTQVAEWQSRAVGIPEQVRILRNVLALIDQEMRMDGDNNPEIFWSVENNTIGEAALIVIDELGEENFCGMLLTEPKKTRGRRVRKGFNTTNRTKVTACAKFKTLVEKRAMKINSRELARQLNFFVASGTGYAAKLGENDDLIMATILIIRMLDQVMWYDESKTEDLRESVGEEVQPMGIFF